MHEIVLLKSYNLYFSEICLQTVLLVLALDIIRLFVEFGPAEVSAAHFYNSKEGQESILKLLKFGTYSGCADTVNCDIRLSSINANIYTYDIVHAVKSCFFVCASIP